MDQRLFIPSAPSIRCCPLTSRCYAQCSRQLLSTSTSSTGARRSSGRWSGAFQSDCFGFGFAGFEGSERIITHDKKCAMAGSAASLRVRERMMPHLEPLSLYSLSAPSSVFTPLPMACQSHQTNLVGSRVRVRHFDLRRPTLAVEECLLGALILARLKLCAMTVSTMAADIGSERFTFSPFGPSDQRTAGTSPITILPGVLRLTLSRL